MPVQGANVSQNQTLSQVLTLSDGRQVGYAEWGDPAGMPVVYCHGFPGSRLEARLADSPAKALGIRLIAPDRPGFGISSPNPTLTLPTWPIDLVEIYSASGDRQTVLLGFVSSAEIPPPKNCCPRRSVISASAVAALDTHRLRLRHIGDTLITRLRRIGVSRRDAPSPLGSRMAFHVGRDVSP